MKKLLALLCIASLVIAPACSWCCKDKCGKDHPKKEMCRHHCKKTECKKCGEKKDKTTKKHHHHKATKEVS